MEVASSLLIGYLIGSLNPAALLSRLKKVDLREHGTKNLGASNALLIFGKASGVFVLLFDLFKAFFSAKIARWLFPQLVLGELLAACAAVVGHIYPLYHKFLGGKGLAAYGGLILAYDPWIFLLLLILSTAAMVAANYSIAMPLTAGILFPILAGVHSRNLAVFAITAAISLLIIVKHWSNLGKARRGEDIRIRDYIRKNFSSRSNGKQA